MELINFFSDTDESDDDYNEEHNDRVKTLPWIEKYRPKTLNDLISHQHIINALKGFIETKYMPHMLFYGPPGTGKTSTILACAKELYGTNFNFMVMELNASDDRGIEVVRNKVKQFVSSDNAFCRMSMGSKNTNSFKLVILDETDAMTDDAQAILRQVVEKYTNNARFCLICNYIEKINLALQSRCISFRFAPLKKDQIVERLEYVVESEKVNITSGGKNSIIKHSKGDMRKVLNMLQSSYMIYDKIDETSINSCFGYPEQETISQIIRYLFTKNIKECCTLIKNTIKDTGISLSDIITEIYDYIVMYVVDNNAVVDELTTLSADDIINILDVIRLIEINQSANTNEDVQIGGLVSLFKL